VSGHSTTRVLILGASGMLGNTALRLFAASPGFEAHGTVRSPASLRLLPEAVRPRVRVGTHAENPDRLAQVLARVQPDVVINCVGVVSQLAEANDPLVAIPVNALLPHRLARLCAMVGARLVHVSTDCVFSGARGHYREDDFPDASDFYGRSKYLGEVDYDNAVTLRTSLIGHELASAHGLLGWFLAQAGQVKGFRKAVFSGLPTVELARVVRDHVIPRPDLHGVYHVAAEPINKYDLLRLVADVYGKDIRVEADDSLVIDRSLDARRFRELTGYVPPSWPQLVRLMHEFG
jgi:dTDP-4-dehydrorhamnose reductase